MRLFVSDDKWKQLQQERQDVQRQKQQNEIEKEKIKQDRKKLEGEKKDVAQKKKDLIGEKNELVKLKKELITKMETFEGMTANLLQIQNNMVIGMAYMNSKLAEFDNKLLELNEKLAKVDALGEKIANIEGNVHSLLESAKSSTQRKIGSDG
ncbi:hypothetical protein ACQ4LE_003930 [Meloidogyne hapla]|uniref:Dynactin subunit 1 n=1 Tax=Meloidogyne hapla TaxID=6305 RepID=A0A1I8BZF3_MELHA